jgi:hypothetical protein
MSFNLINWYRILPENPGHRAQLVQSRGREKIVLADLPSQANPVKTVPSRFLKISIATRFVEKNVR